MGNSDDVRGASATDGESYLHPFRPLGRGIGLRLLLLIVLFSSMVTLASTILQLYVDYRRDVDAIEERLSEIERTHLDTIAASLWHVDAEQLQVQLDGLIRLPDMQLVQVRETVANVTQPLVVTAGEPDLHPGIHRSYRVVYDDRGARREIGVLDIDASLEGVYRRLIDTAVLILITQGIKTFLVSLFILYIVHRLVTRHLMAIAGFLDRFHIGTAGKLALHRVPPAVPDELDCMVTAFNGMRTNLDRAYDELRAVNVALERDIIARRLAEEEVSRLNAVLEQRVRQRTAELEAANAELAAFSYSVSHDLRAPLRRIEGFGQMLVDFYTDAIDDRGRHYLERIRAGTHEMADMIDSFLKLSRATRGELAVEPLDLSALAAEAFDRLREKDPSRQVTVDIQPGITVDGDRKLMAVALTNLVENAWKYTRNTAEAEIRFGTEKAEDGSTVYVLRDNGAGFDMAFADRLFIPFHRLHKPEEFEGTGIGLATVQRIVARHGGRVWAEGVIGQGAVFRFTCWEGRSVDGQPDNPAG
ncbi:MAG TPA: ATP-binding protein [Candidatus Omnitrophota bacterium]|nr:ATP-binding protein [Candidatus Omnitrophota bacterium]